jgi:hypothetical protein
MIPGRLADKAGPAGATLPNAAVPARPSPVTVDNGDGAIIEERLLGTDPSRKTDVLPR